MAASGETELAPIESRDELVTYIEAGEKPKAQWRIGTEHEKFPFYREGLRPVPYEGPAGIRALLEGMAEKSGWRPIFDLENVIALEDPTCALGGSITLEPGGQFELSGAPLQTIFQTCEETAQASQLVREVAAPLGISFLGLGFSPLWTREETPRMPKSRYGIMTAYMPKVGSLGLDMMYRSCTVQVNLDFASEADMVKKLRVSLALQPIAAALFANSPFTEGKPNGYLSIRSAIWLDTDRGAGGHAALRLRGRHGLRALCGLCARCADVFRAARTAGISTWRAPLSAISWTAGSRSFRARSPRSPIGPTI